MIFEKASNKDIEQLTDLRISYLIEDNGALSQEDDEVIRRDLPNYFSCNLNKNIIGYVARNDAEIVSCALLLVVEKPMSPAFITGKTGTVLNVYTKPEYRKKGYAKRLIKMLLDDAAELGLSSVDLKATDEGYPLYKAVGFEDYISKYHQMKITIN